MSLIKLKQVSKFYKTAETVSVGMQNIDLEFDLGEFVVVTGESGSGKSTLLNVVSGLDGYENGEMYLFGEETSHYSIADWERYRGAYVGFVFQNYNIIDSYTVLQNVLLALDIQGYDQKNKKERALELIDKVGLTSHKNHKAAKLSGGQKQRAVIARALAKDCPIIVADEPTGNLDSKSGSQVMKLLHEVSKDKLVILVTHDEKQAEEYATRMVKMHDGEIIEDKKLKKTEKVHLQEKPELKKMGGGILSRFAFRNLFSMPKRLLFVLLLQIIFAIIFISNYTDQISLIREVGLMPSNEYPSVPETRLLIEKRDGTEFNPNELEYIKSIGSVKRVYENAENFYNTYDLWTQTSHLEYSMGVGGTDSAETLSRNDIEGDIPKTYNEIIVSSMYKEAPYNYKIGDEIVLWGYNRSSYSEHEIGTFKISGFDRLNRQILYFSDAYLQSEPSVYTNINGLVYNNLIDGFNNLKLLLNDSHYFYRGWQFHEEDVDIILSSVNEEYQVITTDIILVIYSYELKEEFRYKVEEVKIQVPSEENEFPEYATYSADFFEKTRENFLEDNKELYLMEKRNLVSASVNGYADGNRVIDLIDSETYKIYYPAQSGQNQFRVYQVFFQTLIAIILLVIVGLLLSLVIHLVTRNMMRSRIKDFAIYRSIGANKTDLAKLVIIEQITISILAFMITLIVLIILATNVFSIRRTIGYMRGIDYIILFVIFVFFAIRNGIKFNRKVFNQSVIETLTESREI